MTTQPMEKSGKLTSRLQMATGDPTATDTGLIRTKAGPGFRMKISAGQPITTGVGHGAVTQVGFGFPGADGLRLGVSWRESSDHVGWAPLPPEVADDSQTRVGAWVDNYYDIGPAAYSFVKIEDLSRPTYRDVILTPANNVEFFYRTKNVTDIVYGGNLVAVNGPRYEQVMSQVKIPSYQLDYVIGNEGRFGINPKGNELQVMAPPSKLQQSATVQPKIEKTLGQTQVERGWQEIDQEKTAQLKQTMERQAPVPADLPPKPTPAKPVMANSQNQPAEKGRQQQTSVNPSGSEVSPQSQERSGTQQATPTPQEQPPRPESSPTPAVGEQNHQTRKPAQQEVTLLARRQANPRHRLLRLGALARARIKSTKALLQRPHRPAHPALKCPLLLNHLLRGVRSSGENRNIRLLNRPRHIRKNQEVTRLRRINFLQRNSRESVPKNNPMNRGKRLSHAGTSRQRIGQLTEPRVRKISRKQEKASLGNVNDHLRPSHG